MPDRFHELRSTIVSRRDDDEAYLVLADHLQQIGDPRGELIVLEHMAEQQGGARDAAREYFHAHRAVLMGGMSEAEQYLSGVRWRLGFVRQATLRFQYGEPPALARRAVQAALDAPAMALIDRLNVDVASSDDGYDQSQELERAVMSALCLSPRPSVRSMGLAAIGGRISAKLLCDALPNVETLSVACQRISFGGVKSWSVRALHLFTGAVPVGSFKTVDWRALESLSLTASIEGSLTELLAAVPALASFAISTAPKDVEVVGSLVESGAVRRLRRLRIDPIGARELEALKNEAHRFEALERIEISRGIDEVARHLPATVEVVHPGSSIEATDEDPIGIDYED